MLNIKCWMDQVCLKRNRAKTEFIYFGNKAQPRKCVVDSLNVASDLILRSDSIHYIGAWLDENLALSFISPQMPGSNVESTQDQEYKAPANPGHKQKLSTKFVHVTSGLL